MKTLLVLLTMIATMGVAAPIDGAPPLPEFTNSNPDHWFNSGPLQRADLMGKVVLIDVWTYDCWNCYRSFPWLNALEKQFSSEDFLVVGIHSPEFAHEKEPDRVAAKIEEFDLHHPVMMDNDLHYWRALDNRYWPAFYLVDRQGRLRHLHVGETHIGDRRAEAIQRQIRQLLNEND